MVTPTSTAHDPADGALVDAVVGGEVNLSRHTSPVPAPDLPDLLVGQLGSPVAGTSVVPQPGESSVGQVLASCDVLQVRGPVIGLDAVDVVDGEPVARAHRPGWRRQKGGGDQRMNVGPSLIAAVLECHARVAATIGLCREDFARNGQLLAVAANDAARQGPDSAEGRDFVASLEMSDGSPFFCVHGPSLLVQQDAYQVGDRVTFEGQTWESTAANNVWSPGVFGWVVV